MAQLRFGSYNLLLILTFLSFCWGGAWMWFGFVFSLAVTTLGDRLLPHDTSEIPGDPSQLMNTFLYSLFPLLLLNVLAFIWQMTPGDWLGWGAWVDSIFGVSILERKQELKLLDQFGAILSIGILCASGGTNVAHELVHRTWDPKALHVGRWLLSFTFDTSFAIEHVYGHHANVATLKDPASARRGETCFRFFWRSTRDSFLGAWRIESERLRKRKLPIWSRHNQFLQGQLMSMALLLLYASAGGLEACLLALIVGFYGKAYLELVNYIEHYGIVRVPGTPVAPRHSWNSNHAFSSLLLYNLTRHSHHHEKGHLPFWKLKPMPDTPSLPYGYMTMILLALIPPLFEKIMQPLLKDWDQRFATKAEQQLIKQQYQKSA